MYLEPLLYPLILMYNRKKKREYDFFSETTDVICVLLHYALFFIIK